MHAEARQAIHVLHRYGAIILAVFIVLMSYQLIKQDDKRLRLFGFGFLAVFIVQFCLGLANIYYFLPLAVAVGHNFFGACLFVLTVSLYYLVFSKRGRLNEF
jgi:cytochrome c oxidase assembly protein subunit 15